jgi:DNA helicase II / ATP-dependent DNA helicase PcrA
METNQHSYITRLNEPQKQGVLTLHGPVLMLAGAGTGKTAALTSRLAHILATRSAWPSEILALTFTNKAASEMRERVRHLIGDVVESMPWLGTFHAIGAKLLRRHAEHIGLSSSFIILDTDDQLRLLKQIIIAAGLDEKRFPARALAGCIDLWKNKGLTPEHISKQNAYNFAEGRGKELYAQYQKRLLELNAVDFGDLLLHLLTLLQSQTDILQHYQNKFKFIMVDEYQDTNTVQYLILRMLAQAHKNICCVGDDDQSIYSWRGAVVSNILRFEQDFPGATIIKLEQNYRSTQHILSAASGLIAKNTERHGKTLWTEKAAGEKVRVEAVWDGAEEARRVSDSVERLEQKGVSLSECAILVRAQFQTREFEDRFIAIGLPYRILGGFRFYERAEIRDALAYLRVVASLTDDLAFERVFNTPKRGLGDKAMQAVRTQAQVRGSSLAQAAHFLAEHKPETLAAAARKSFMVLMQNYAQWRDYAHRDTPAALLRKILEESGYSAALKANPSVENTGRLENLNELVRALEDYDTLTGFLEHVSLVMERDDQAGREKLILMTIHAAKGLEFAHTYLVGWEEGIFPSQKSLDENGLAALEEERRLGYVAITRARTHCTISYAANRRIYGQWNSSLPSRFIHELPEENIVHNKLGESYGYLSQTPIRGVAQPYSKPEKVQVKEKVSEIPIGARVFHTKFGYGRVEAVEGEKLEINFEQGTRKHILDSFVSLA